MRMRVAWGGASRQRGCGAGQGPCIVGCPKPLCPRAVDGGGLGGAISRGSPGGALDPRLRPRGQLAMGGGGERSHLPGLPRRRALTSDPRLGFGSPGSQGRREPGSPGSQGRREPGSQGAQVARGGGSQGAREPGSQGAQVARGGGSQGAREPGSPGSQGRREPGSQGAREREKGAGVSLCDERVSAALRSEPPANSRVLGAGRADIDR